MPEQIEREFENKMVNAKSKNEQQALIREYEYELEPKTMATMINEFELSGIIKVNH